MRVLIIPEDPTLDRHVIAPIVTRIFHDLGRTARDEVLTDPHLRGVDQALDPKVIAEVVADHAMIDLFLLVVDRDCDRTNNARRAADREAEHPDRLIAALAREEVEVWALALHRSALGVSFSTIRADCDPKERYFEPFVAAQGWRESVGKGRKRAMRNLGAAWPGVLTVCPEIAVLKEAIQAWIAARAQ